MLCTSRMVVTPSGGGACDGEGQPGSALVLVAVVVAAKVTTTP